ncbi:MAG: hypothetical protein GTO40_08000 [Deltaproteobacteria bacterium]|nr:hypothetical protein [Deltaproteobacteria bacterium]
MERLEAKEKEEAKARKVEEYKFPSDDEMLQVVAGDEADAVGVANGPVKR